MIAVYSANVRKGARIIASTTGHADHDSAARAVFAMTLEGNACATWCGVGMDIRFHNRPRVTFEEAAARAAELSAAVDVASAPLREFPKGAMGLVPDAVAVTPEYRAARAAYLAAFNALTTWNAGYVKQFKKEIRAARDARNVARAANLARLSPAN